MTFIWANLLWLLLLIPILVLVYILLMRRKKRNALRFASLAVVRAAMGKGSGFRRHLPPLLFLLAVIVMILAVARPAAYVTLPSESGTVILAIDVSGSMRATDIKPSRIGAAKEAATTFVKGQPHNVRVGVVAFSTYATLVQPPTLNRDAVLAAIDRLYPERATAIGSGILVALSAIFPNYEFDLGSRPGRYGSGGLGSLGGSGGFGGYGGFGGGAGVLGGGGFGSGGLPGVLNEPSGNSTFGQGGAQKQPLPPPVPPGSDRSAAIVLLTDGQSNTGVNPVQAAQKAADLGVRIYTVGLGTTNGQIIGFGGWRAHVQLNEQDLKRIASLTLGKYFRATNYTDLKEIYRGLSTRLITETKKNELSALFTAAAAILILAAGLLSLMWFGRVT